MNKKMNESKLNVNERNIRMSENQVNTTDTQTNRHRRSAGLRARVPAVWPSL